MARSVLVLALLAVVPAASGLGIHIDAHEEECFFDTIKVGTKVGVSFQVAEGGFLDIDVTIKGPDEKIIYSGERETDGKYTFSAHMDGIYRYCFSNKMSTMTPKLVVFNVAIGGQTHSSSKEIDEKHDRLHDSVRELAEALYNVKREQSLMDVREHTHRQINESTNSRVVYWSFFEAMVLLTMSIGQIYYIHRFFEVRTTV